MQFGQTLRYALRSFSKNPGLPLIILLTVALGVGANTAIFTVDYATLLAPLPYPHPDQLVSVWSKTKFDRTFPSPKTFLAWRQQNLPFQDFSAFVGTPYDIGSAGQQEGVCGMRATANYYRTLGSSFFLGRNFLEQEEQDGKNHVVILTHKLWNHLGADPNLVGHTLRVNGEVYTVVGVLAPGIADRDVFQMAVPLVFTPEELHQDALPVAVAGRLKPRVTMQQAEDQMDAVAKHLALSNPTGAKVMGAALRPIQAYMESLSSQMKRTLWLLLAAVGFVLLIACVNVASLLLSRGMARQKEVAVRCALGAMRRTIFAQMLLESLLLAMAGGTLGIGLGYGMLRFLLAAVPPFTLPWQADMRLNLPVLLFTLSVATLAGLLFGCVPAWYGSRTDPAEALKTGGSAGLAAGRHRLQRTLVIAELALGLSIVTGAGLALHSFVNLMRVDMGVRTDHVLTFYLSALKTQPKQSEKLVAYYRQILSSIQSVPGVSSASAQTRDPLFPPHMTPFLIAGSSTSNTDSSTWPKAGLETVTPGYFRTFGIRLVKGRIFNEQDTASGAKVALVNEDFVRSYLNGADPLRQRIVIEQSADDENQPQPPTEWQIVGVYHDVRSGSMREHPPEMEVPFWQMPSPGANIAVRTAEDPDSMIKSIAAAVHSVDSEAFLARPRTMGEIRTQVLGYDRFTMILFVSFGALALLLATLGVYGVMSFSVTERTREIALRMAVGAGRPRVIGEIIKQGIWLASVGLSFGLIGVYFVGHAMRSTLFGIGGIDFTVVGATAFLLLLAALLACLFPAARAASVEPMQALRSE